MDNTTKLTILTCDYITKIQEAHMVKMQKEQYVKAIEYDKAHDERQKEIAISKEADEILDQMKAIRSVIE